MRIVGLLPPTLAACALGARYAPATIGRPSTPTSSPSRSSLPNSTRSLCGAAASGRRGAVEQIPDHQLRKRREFQPGADLRAGPRAGHRLRDDGGLHSYAAATPDVREFRQLLRDGYRDGAAQAGAGLPRTHPSDVIMTALRPLASLAGRMLDLRCGCSEPRTMTTARRRGLRSSTGSGWPCSRKYTYSNVN